MKIFRALFLKMAAGFIFIEPILFAFILFVLLLCILYILFKFAKFKAWVEHHKVALEEINTILSIIAVFSLFFTVLTYTVDNYNNKKISEQDFATYLSNAKTDVNNNLVIANSVLTNESEWRNTGDVIISRYNYDDLSKIVDSYPDEVIRVKIIDYISLLDDGNREFDEIENLPAPLITVSTSTAEISLPSEVNYFNEKNGYVNSVISTAQTVNTDSVWLQGNLK